MFDFVMKHVTILTEISWYQLPSCLKEQVKGSILQSFSTMGVPPMSCKKRGDLLKDKQLPNERWQLLWFVLLDRSVVICGARAVLSQQTYAQMQAASINLWKIAQCLLHMMRWLKVALKVQWLIPTEGIQALTIWEHFFSDDNKFNFFLNRWSVNLRCCPECDIFGCFYVLRRDLNDATPHTQILSFTFQEMDRYASIGHIVDF